MRRTLSTSTALVCASIVMTSAQRVPGTAGVAHRLSVISQHIAELRDWDRRVDRLVDTGALQLRKTRPDTLLPDRTHERFDQYVGGVRIVGGDLARQVHHGVTESVFGTVFEGVTLDTVPTLSEDAARVAFSKLTGIELPLDRRIELVVLPIDGGAFALAWRTHLSINGTWMLTFLDAHTGAVVRQYNDLQTQSAVGTGTGVLGDRKKISTRPLSGRYVADDQLRPPLLITYDARGNLAAAKSWLFSANGPGVSDIASDDDNAWTDAANVDAHVHLGWTYDYYYKRFGRNGLDDGNSPIRALTHPVRRSDFFVASDDDLDYYVNAFWCTGCGPGGQGMMMFGEGVPIGATFVGRSWNYTSGALDVVAHELSHGVTSYTSDLEYHGESGALNEAFSDIIGTSVEFFFQPTGTAAGQADYLIGEDVVTPGGIRSMANPLAFGDPDHYSRRFTGDEDNGGVHINAGIATHAFYLAIEGGVNRTSGLAVQGVGSANREQIEKVFYRAFVFLLPSTASFSTARAATIQSARDLYGVGSAAETAVTQAWTAVGVN
jgi:bacillolysin